jgi:hypothetical protein
VIACLQMTWLRDERGDLIAASCGRRDGHPGPHVDNSLDYQWTTARRPEQVP